MYQSLLKYGRLLMVWSLLVGMKCTVFAQSVNVISKAEAGRSGDSVEVFITLNPEQLSVGANEALTVFPVLVAEAYSLEMPAIHILGRNTYYRYLRHDDLGLVMPSDQVIWEKRKYRPYAYLKTEKWQSWMDEASLKVTLQRTDCQKTDVQTATIFQPARQVEMPTTHHVAVRKGTVIDQMTIVFPLNRAEIHPELSDNQRELDKIRRSLQDAESSGEREIQSLTIKGHASPEGPYKFNDKLARQRTDSLGSYISRNYHLDREKIKTDYEAEDWEGLIAFITKATIDQLPHRDELLAIAKRDDLTPDRKEFLMRGKYPKDFHYLLEYCMPNLRHSDYRIDYLRKEYVEQPPETNAYFEMPKAKAQNFGVYKPLKPYKMWFALKTNLLFDAVLAFNGEIEVPIGKGNRWSVMAEFWKPWYVWRKNSRAYQLQVIGGEVRYWFGSCRQRKPLLTGLFAGVYYARGKYDFEWDTDHRNEDYNGVGDQGEFNSIGATAGYAWAIHRRLNLELSASVGTLWGPRRHYHGEFDDTHLIWKYTTTSRYTGPTKLKVSLVWLIGKRRCHQGKEGRL